MAINDLINESWQGHGHGEVEDALKAVLVQLLDAIERIPQGGISIDELSDSLKTLINNAVPNTRKVNNKALNSDITLGAADVGALPADTVIPDGVTVDSAMSSTSEHAVQNKVVKAYVDAAVLTLQNALNTLIGSGNVQGAIDTFNEVTAFLAGISSSDTLAAKLALLVPQSCTINSKPLTGNITIGINDIDGLAAAIANAGSGAVSVTTNEDGTFVIHVGDTDYTINLNHTHEDMAKLVVCEESDLPSTLDNSTIYAITDSGETEIEKLIIRGMEFAGGGYAPGAPHLVNPTSSQISNGINIGNTTSGVATYSIKIKAKDITQSLIVEWGNGSTGYSFNTSNLPTGVTYDSGTGKLTITVAAATAINGVNIPIVYTGNDTDENAEGTLGISSSSVDGINVEVTLLVNKVTYTDLAGVKLTGTQWLQTDYYPNTNTEFSLECKLTANSRTGDSTTGNGTWILRCNYDTSTNERFTLHTSYGGSDNAAYSLFYMNKVGPENQKEIIMRTHTTEFVSDHAIISYVKGASDGTLTFNGGTARTVSTALQTETLTSPMCIGYRPDTQMIFNVFDLTIYGLTITENGNTVHHWVPKSKNGVPGLYDTVNNTFISSETATELVAIS